MHILYRLKIFGHPEYCCKEIGLRGMHPNDADRMANSADPDQTAPLGAV